MNKKGFTLVELLAVVFILGLLLALAVGVYNSYLTNSRNNSYKMEEENFISATKGAYLDCQANNRDNNFCSNHKQMYITGEKSTIYLKELIDDEYIDNIKDPYNSDRNCDVDDSYVIVENITPANSINSTYSYTVCLICGTRSSESCH